MLKSTFLILSCLIFIPTLALSDSIKLDAGKNSYLIQPETLAVEYKTENKIHQVSLAGDSEFTVSNLAVTNSTASWISEEVNLQFSCKTLPSGGFEFTIEAITQGITVTWPRGEL